MRSEKLSSKTDGSKHVSRRALVRMLGGVPAVAWLGGCAGGTPSSAEGDAPLVAQPESFVRFVREGDKIVVETNNIPNHATGKFPNRGCPNRIRPVNARFELSASPRIAAEPRPIEGWIFGIGLNGVVFDPTGPFLFEDGRNTGYHFEVMSAVARPHLGLDESHAHVQPSGEYHYHGLPVGLLDAIGAHEAMTLIGYAADGFPIYGPYGTDDPADLGSEVRAIRSSYRLKRGLREDAIPGGVCDGTFVQDYEYVAEYGDLDDCNGRFGATREYPDGIYHYFVTSEFPFVPRAWRGTPDATFAHALPGPSAVPPALRKYRGTTVSAATSSAVRVTGGER